MTDTMSAPSTTIGVATPEAPVVMGVPPTPVADPQIIQEAPQSGIRDILDSLRLLKEEDKPTPAETGVSVPPQPAPDLGPTITQAKAAEQPAGPSVPAFQAASTTTVSEGLGTVPEASAATPVTQITPDMIKPGADGGIPSATNVVEALVAEKTPLTPEQNTAAREILSVLTDPATLDVLKLLKTQVT